MTCYLCPSLFWDVWQAEMSRIVLQVAALQKEVEEIDKQVAEAERMLKFADPGVVSPVLTDMCRQLLHVPQKEKASCACMCTFLVDRVI